MNFPAMDVDQFYITDINVQLQSRFEAQSEVIGYTHNNYATITAVGT